MKMLSWCHSESFVSPKTSSADNGIQKDSFRMDSDGILSGRKQLCGEEKEGWGITIKISNQGQYGND